ncbi:MAG TPA: phospholipase [Solirubrobacteraceae bacterium]
MSALHYEQRPAAGEPHGLVILNHGRGTDELDLLGLADLLDPARRFTIVTPRAPLSLTGSPGYHWYLVPRVGFPDPETFATARLLLAELHDELWASTGLKPERTVLGGFSMGCVMSYALGLDAARPRPAGILAMSGFIPSVPGWEPDLAHRRGLPVFAAHGSADPVIPVELGRGAAELLAAGGLAVEYEEFAGSHRIVPDELQDATSWLQRVLPAEPPR